MKHTPKILLLTACATSLLVLACGCSQTTDSSDAAVVSSTVTSQETADNGNIEETNGMVTSIEGNTIQLSVMNQPGGGPGREGGPGMDGERPDGERPANGEEAPSGMEPPAENEMPATDDSTPAGSAPAQSPGGNATPPEGDRPEEAGETIEIVVDGNTELTLLESGDTLAVEDIVAGDMLRVALAEDGTTAVSIQVMRMADGMPGEMPSEVSSDISSSL